MLGSCRGARSPSPPPVWLRLREDARAHAHLQAAFTDGTCSTRQKHVHAAACAVRANSALAVAFRASVQTGAFVYAPRVIASPSIPLALPRVVCLAVVEFAPCVLLRDGMHRELFESLNFKGSRERNFESFVKCRLAEFRVSKFFYHTIRKISLSIFFFFKLEKYRMYLCKMLSYTFVNFIFIFYCLKRYGINLRTHFRVARY